MVPLRALREHGFDLNIPRSPKSMSAHRVPRKAQLLSSAPSGLIEQAFMDAYFMNYHTSYPFVHEATFRAQFYEQIPRPHGPAWHILLNTILALGAWCIGDDTSDLDITFYQEARSQLQQMSVFEAGNLTLVQALLLLSNYAQKRDKPNTGWNFLGLAVRMAMSLGLHKEFREWKISLLQREIRRRLWWGVYLFDSGAAKTFGRPILLPEEHIMDAKRVLNIHDEVQSSSPVRRHRYTNISQKGSYSSNYDCSPRIRWPYHLFWHDRPGGLSSPHEQCLSASYFDPKCHSGGDSSPTKAHG